MLIRNPRGVVKSAPEPCLSKLYGLLKYIPVPNPILMFAVGFRIPYPIRLTPVSDLDTDAGYRIGASRE